MREGSVFNTRRTRSILLTCLMWATSPGTVAVQAQTYTTSFNLTEKPISEGGTWINGRVVGLDWADCLTVNGRICASQIPTDLYADNTALLAGTWGPDQTVTATFYYVPSRDHPNAEIEIRLRSALSAHSCTGYELDFYLDYGGSSPSLNIVRWNGAHADFTILKGPKGCSLKNGDIIKGTVIGNVITAYVNGAQILQATDNVIKSGSPGVGFDQDVGDADMSSWGFSDFAVTCTGGSTGLSGHPSKPKIDGTSGFPLMADQAAYNALGRFVPAPGAHSGHMFGGGIPLSIGGSAQFADRKEITLARE